LVKLCEVVEASLDGVCSAEIVHLTAVAVIRVPHPGEPLYVFSRVAIYIYIYMMYTIIISVSGGDGLGRRASAAGRADGGVRAVGAGRDPFEFRCGRWKIDGSR